MKNKKILITAIMSLALLFPVTAKATTGVSINCPSKTIARGATMTCSVVANVDEDISYCQGMNIITGFILIMTEYNETNAWYILISLFCENFMLHEIPSLPSVSFPLRGLFSDDFPLLHFLLYIFDNAISIF